MNLLVVLLFKPNSQDPILRTKAHGSERLPKQFKGTHAAKAAELERLDLVFKAFNSSNTGKTYQGMYCEVGYDSIL